MEVGLEISTEENMYMVVFHYKNVGQNHNLLIANKALKSLLHL
jgi:hypothetical protein